MENIYLWVSSLLIAFQKVEKSASVVEIFQPVSPAFIILCPNLPYSFSCQDTDTNLHNIWFKVKTDRGVLTSWPRYSNNPWLNVILSCQGELTG